MDIQDIVIRSKSRTSPREHRTSGQDGEISVVVDISGRDDIRLYEGFIGSGWRINGDRLWTDEWPFGSAISHGLVGKTVDALIDFSPLRDRQITGLLGGPQPYGIVFQKDLIDIEIP